MAWVKRNLFWVLGGVFAVGLLGGAFYYLWSSLQAEKEIDQQLTEKVATRDRLNNANPHPGNGDVDNVVAAKKDADRVQGFLKDKVKTEFKPIPVDTVRDTYDFKLLLDRTLADLEHNAEQNGVGLPSKPYSFTFDTVKKSATLDPPALQPLAQQLMEIKAICDILFTSKVHSLEAVRRVPVSRVDSGTQDYLSLKATTNNLGVLTPYEVIFKGFSGELAAVANRLAQSDHCFIIRTLNTEVTTPSMITPSAPGVQGAFPGTLPPTHDATMSRYGMMRRPGGAEGGADPRMSRYGRYGMPPPPENQPQLTAPTPRAGPTNVIAEKPLRITMRIDSVQLKPAK